MDKGSECFKDVRADDAWSGDEQVHEVTKARLLSFHSPYRHLPTPFDTRLPLLCSLSTRRKRTFLAGAVGLSSRNFPTGWIPSVPVPQRSSRRDACLRLRWWAPYWCICRRSVQKRIPGGRKRWSGVAPFTQFLVQSLESEPVSSLPLSYGTQLGRRLPTTKEKKDVVAVSKDPYTPARGCFFWRETCEMRAKAIQRLAKALKSELEAMKTDQKAHGCASEAFL